MHQNIKRPMIVPCEFLNLYPEFKTDTVYYKCYYLYRKHKDLQGNGTRVLS